LIVILDFGSQYNQLIARRVRAFGVAAQILPFDTECNALEALRPSGLILSGGPASVHRQSAPQLDPRVLDLGLPVLGICYGMQALAQANGGTVRSAEFGEYGLADLHVTSDDPLFAELNSSSQVWMSHRDAVVGMPSSWSAIASTENCPHAAIRRVDRPWWGLQFHPEVHHTHGGERILQNFVFGVCRAEPTWEMSSWIENRVDALRREIGGHPVVAAVSGGVDSTVMAVLLQRAVGGQLTCLFVDNGLLRLHEADDVMAQFAALGVPAKRIEARRRFLGPLAGVEDPEEKRRIIGRVFIEVLGEHLGPDSLLAQGTLYPDVIESVPTNGPSATIKTHHNRVAEVLGLLREGRVIEPLRDLFKDEVREVGLRLGIAKDSLSRHPFPGPGLAVRILGAVDEERLEILRLADRAVTEELRDANLLDEATWQAFAVLLPVRSVGVMGDERTYENVVAVRAVTSTDAMTADWARLPHDVLARISNRIINEIAGVNRVVYDISSKPPSTIEWE
jgi:GMP synthase (glutamine-hydrolysing)